MLVADFFGKLIDLAGELSHACLVHKPGQRLTQARTLPGYPWPHQKTEYRQTDYQQEVNDRDRPHSAVDKLFQSCHGGIDEGGEEKREGEDDQSPGRGIEKTQSQGEKQ